MILCKKMSMTNWFMFLGSGGSDFGVLRKKIRGVVMITIYNACSIMHKHAGQHHAPLYWYQTCFEEWKYNMIPIHSYRSCVNCCCTKRQRVVGKNKKKKKKRSWPWRDSNTQPSDLESDALPLRHRVITGSGRYASVFMPSHSLPSCSPARSLQVFQRQACP